MARHHRSPRGGPQKTTGRLTKEQRAKRAREHDTRRREALEATRRAQAALEARMAREAEQPAVGPAPGATYVMSQETRDLMVDLAATYPGFPGLPEQRKAPEEPPEEPAPVEEERRPTRGRLPVFEAEGESYTLGQARKLVRAGYHVCHVMHLTGYGWKWFNDMALDEDGYGLPL